MNPWEEEMKLLRYAALGLLALMSLAGCASREQIVAQHRSKCEGYGFEAGSEAFANCLLQLDLGHTGWHRHSHRHWPG